MSADAVHEEVRVAAELLGEPRQQLLLLPGRDGQLPSLQGHGGYWEASAGRLRESIGPHVAPGPQLAHLCSRWSRKKPS